MQSTAQGYLVYELTKSPAYSGYVGFASGLHSWLFMLYGGVIADRMPDRNSHFVFHLPEMLYNEVPYIFSRKQVVLRSLRKMTEQTLLLSTLDQTRRIFPCPPIFY